MLDWLGRMIGLPKEFLPFTENGRGGGVIQVSPHVIKVDFGFSLAKILGIRKRMYSRFVASRTFRDDEATTRSLSFRRRRHPLVQAHSLLFQGGAFIGRKSLHDRFGEVEDIGNR